MSASPRRLGLYVPWVLFVVFCVGWSAYWFAVRDRTQAALASATRAIHAGGGEFTFARVRYGGFPLHLTMTLSKVRAQLPGRGNFQTDTLPVSVNLSNPRHVIIGLATPVSWRGAAKEMHTLTARRGEMSLRFIGDGKLARLSLVLNGAAIGNGAPPGVLYRAPLPSTEIGTVLLHARPDPRNGADLQVVFEAENWRGPTPAFVLSDFGPFDHVRIAAVLPQGVKRWPEAVRLEKFDVASSSGAVTGDGALHLDERHRPEGVLNLKPANGPAFQVTARDGWWSVGGTHVAPAREIQFFAD